MDYRDIITLNLREAIKKRDKAREGKKVNEENYWSWIAGQLLEDLRDYEKRGRWNREPFDEAWKKYRSHRHLSVEDIIRSFFEDGFPWI